MSTITQEQQDAIAAYLNGRHIPKGLGTEESACSIAAINLALSGELTDEIPDCMCPIVGKWIIRIQDAMPDEIRNSAKWRALLPLAAGTGQKHEKERLKIVMDWMWFVLSTMQPIADECGFGDEWKEMIAKKTAKAAHMAKKAAQCVESAEYAEYAVCTECAVSAEYAVCTEHAAEHAAEYAVSAVCTVCAEHAATWNHFDPCQILESLIKVSNDAI